MYLKHKQQKASGETDSSLGRKLSKAVELVQTKNEASGAVHSYSEPEVRAFSQYINDNLSGDPLCKKYLPLIGVDLFTKMKDGVLLMYVLLLFQFDWLFFFKNPGTIMSFKNFNIDSIS